MASVVFMRGINVGGKKTLKPSELARSLSDYDVTSIGAAGTFVVRRQATQAVLRKAIQTEMSVEAEIIIRPAREVSRLVEDDPFTRRKAADSVKAYVSVLNAAPMKTPSLPITQPAGREWQVRIFDIRGRLALSEHRRSDGRLIYPNEVVERQLGVAATTRTWNTIRRIHDVLTKR